MYVVFSGAIQLLGRTWNDTVVRCIRRWNRLTLKTYHLRVFYVSVRLAPAACTYKRTLPWACDTLLEPSCQMKNNNGKNLASRTARARSMQKCVLITERTEGRSLMCYARGANIEVAQFCVVNALNTKKYTTFMGGRLGQGGPHYKKNRGPLATLAGGHNKGR